MVLDVAFSIPNEYLAIQLPRDSKTIKGWDLLGILFDEYFELFYNEINCLTSRYECHILSVVPEKELSSSFKDGPGPQKLNFLACTSWKENQGTTCTYFTAFFPSDSWYFAEFSADKPCSSPLPYLINSFNSQVGKTSIHSMCAFTWALIGYY